MDDSSGISPTETEVSAKKKSTINYTVRTFAPELWGQIDYFAAFFSASFPEAKRIEHRAVAATGNHFRKAVRLQSLAIRMRASLEIDRQQLAEKGYTPAAHAVELAAIVENVFTELYSAVDCARQVFYARHQVRGLPDSTRRTFVRIRSGVLDDVLPPEILSAFKEADWYDPLRVLRDEFTHGDVGSVHLSEMTGKVSYMHIGLGTRTTAFVIEDIFERMETDLNAVNAFLGKIFYQLKALLRDVPVTQLCGLHEGKALIREIRPEPTITFDSGKCLAIAWIEKQGNPTCPLVCRAYWRAKADAGT